MRQQRTRLVVSVGNLLEILGAAGASVAVGHLAGFWWGVLLAAALTVLAAELIYDAHVWRIPLPHRPQPRQRLAERRQALAVWRSRRVVAFRRWRADRQDRALAGRTHP